MKKFSKKIMEFLFGTKYPIFNKKGKIQHSRDQFVEEWKTRYKNDPNYDWKTMLECILKITLFQKISSIRSICL